MTVKRVDEYRLVPVGNGKYAVISNEKCTIKDTIEQALNTLGSIIIQDGENNVKDGKSETSKSHK